ncbi:invasion associated locus B family protein [uncultured Sulfitobacter sp.]|uniref:invasion associated locus B family protein n=1 Tax=uncultured Sulfitobacter sp. TaxID=191468 RepID=UPI0030D770C8|tara:strand:+ start:42435 stop:43067 length:633 start_codon:yes stop_codon:yes gene_type:complete
MKLAIERFTLSLLALFLVFGPAAAQQTYPEPKTRNAVGDWVVECFEPNSIAQECQLYQRVLMNNGSAIAMVMVMAFGPPNNTLYIQAALPLGISVANGVNVRIDDAVSLNIPISRCTQQGCLIEGEVNETLENAMRLGTEAAITVLNPTEGAFVIPMSLSGFNEALTEIEPGNTDPGLVQTDNNSDPSLVLDNSEEEQVDNTLSPVTSRN